MAQWHKLQKTTRDSAARVKHRLVHRARVYIPQTDKQCSCVATCAEYSVALDFLQPLTSDKKTGCLMFQLWNGRKKTQTISDVNCNR